MFDEEIFEMIKNWDGISRPSDQIAHTIIYGVAEIFADQVNIKYEETPDGLTKLIEMVVYDNEHDSEYKHATEIQKRFSFFALCFGVEITIRGDAYGIKKYPDKELEARLSLLEELSKEGARKSPGKIIKLR